MEEKSKIKTVLFDLGGVVIDYKDREKYLSMLKLIESRQELKERFVDFECGKITLHDVEEEFLALFGVTHKKDIETMAIKNIGSKNPYISQAIEVLREKNYTLGILTNTGFLDQERQKSTYSIIQSMDGFNFVIESCRLGVRKPEATFYELSLKKNGLEPSECVFIDDLEENCIAAREIGIRSIWLKDGDAKTAIAELEAILNVKLLL